MGVLPRCDQAPVAQGRAALDVRLDLWPAQLGAGAFHLWWCREHGIDPLTAEPKDRYYELLGWDRDRRALAFVENEPLSPRKLTAEALAHAIRAVTTDDRMRKRAAALGEKIRVERGVARAVELIESAVR